MLAPALPPGSQTPATDTPRPYSFLRLLFLFLVVLALFIPVGLFGVDPGVELGEDFPDVSQRVADVAGLERAVFPGVAGDLGGDPQEVQVLPPHLQEDLALGV